MNPARSHSKRTGQWFSLEPLESRCLLSSITEYSVPQVNGIDAGPAEITSDGGKLWFTDQHGNAIGTIDPANPTSVQSYSQGLSGSLPVGITTGPDGNIWFTELGTHSIGILSTANPSQPIFQFSFRSLTGLLNNALPAGITTGPHGNIWFTDPSHNAIGKITVMPNPADDAITGFSVPSDMVGFASVQSQIVAGPGGKLYFTEATFNPDYTISKSAIGSYDPATGTWGQSELLGSGQQPFDLAVGPDQNIWFGEAVPASGGGSFSSSAIGAIDLTRTTPPVLAEISTTVPPGGVTPEPYRIAAGPDGNLWFVDTANGAIGSVNLTPNPASDTITAIPIPKTAAFPNSLPQGIATGPDGNIYFADFHNAIGKVTLDTKLVITSQPTAPVLAGSPFGLTAQVEYSDTNAIDRAYTGNVTIALTSPGSNVLGGTTTMPVTAGVASFSTLTLANPGTNFTLTATAGILTSAPSAGINVTAPTPPPAPQVQGAIVLIFQKTNKKGKKIDKPVLTGYQFTFNTAMNQATAGNAANYSVQNYVLVNMKVGKRIKKVQKLKPIGFTLKYISSNTVQLLTGKQAFKLSGQINLVATPPGGISSPAGTYLNGNAVYKIAKGGFGITPA